MKALGTGVVVLFLVAVVDLLMGLPTYGLVRTIHGGTYNYSDDHNPVVMLWVLLWGLPGLALIALFCWRIFR